MNAAISLTDVCAGYRRRQVNDRVTFDVTFGSVTCLLGANGCGKTTLLKTLLGLLPLFSGRVELDGQRLSQWTRQALARFVGYVPQAQTGMFPFLAEDVVVMGRTARLKWYATPTRHDRVLAREALASLGIAHLAPRRFTELSGGERQLVLIARALTQEAKVLLLDEPTASLDYGNQLRVLMKLKGLKEQGKTILMTTHHPDHAKRVADNVVLMKDGGVFAQGAPAAMLSDANLSEVYGIDTLTV
jgi:iron complex transport system ATP-binding protein